ncbi:DUF1036 domain-containing protein [Jiella mangrovi]|uniref:DUF1036 domain-containing protein n=1 Tax=Jiella mangrovi TaxID=2821407 RepID=A0ABS4BJ69_9HYPH|nr:DUF1036 domain-containing protein [Jiella mangrovi]MBP0616741.1 DUF1036 domain-containing protein [Jiella mangrovi]
MPWRIILGRWPGRAIRASCAALLFALALLAGRGAQAQFVVCNQTLDVVNVAIGSDGGSGFTTEGWWIVGANRCATTLRDELEARYVYVYANDVFGRSVLYGSTPMCVGQKGFRIVGTDACYQRGYRPAKFLEVDTRAVSRWTLFLSPRS